MSQAPLATGVAVYMQSALDVAKTVTAVTKANPGVASSTAHGFANGDYFLMTSQGMREINNRVFRAAGVAANTVNLEGEDTTLFNTFASGNMKKITFGTTFATFAEVNASGGQPEEKDATTIHDVIKKVRYGMASAIQFSITSQWDIADAGLQAAIAASKIKAERAFMFAFEDGTRMVFNGTVFASGVPNMTTGDLVTTPISISCNGLPTYYTT